MIIERAKGKTFQDFIVWRKAHEFVLAVYRFTATFPKHETYALAVQMRRAATSVAANIAEGFRKRGRADKVRFMNTAERSLEESRVLFDFGARSGLRTDRASHERSRRSQSTSERVCSSYSVF
jgi:four helix bundle protein